MARSSSLPTTGRSPSSSRTARRRDDLDLRPGPLSAASVLSDGTLVVLNGAGDFIGIHHHAIAFRTHILEPGSLVRFDVRMNAQFHPSPRVVGLHMRRPVMPDRDPNGALRLSTLPLADGGVAVTFDRELVLLDTDGAVRARAEAPVALASPLLALQHSVAFVGDAGDVYERSLANDAESVRPRGSFGGSVEGNIVVEDGRHLLAIVRGSRARVARPAHGDYRDASERDGWRVQRWARARAGDGLPAGDHDCRDPRHDRRPDRNTSSFPLALTVQGLSSLGLPDAGDGRRFGACGGRGSSSTRRGPWHTRPSTATSGSRRQRRSTSWGTSPAEHPRSPRPTPMRSDTGRRSASQGSSLGETGPFVVACEAGGVSMVKGIVD